MVRREVEGGVAGTGDTVRSFRKRHTPGMAAHVGFRFDVPHALEGENSPGRLREPCAADCRLVGGSRAGAVDDVVDVGGVGGRNRQLAGGGVAPG